MTMNASISLFEKRNEVGASLENISFLQEMFDSLPYPTFLIDANRNVILANQELLDMVKPENNNNIIGLKPGEMLGCVNTLGASEECGSTDKCQFCDANGAILQCMITDKKITRDGRFIVRRGVREEHLDLSITSSPQVINGQKFCIVSLIDRTADRRKRMMERFFFHDVLNLAHGLGNTLQISMMNECSTISGRTLENAQKIMRSLMDEIQFQKNILSAEAGDLSIKISTFGSRELLEDLIDHMAHSRESVGKNITIVPDSVDIVLTSDRLLLRRVLMNMVKNALEAIPRGKEVRMDCRKSENEVTFYIQNDGRMSDEVQAQIWQRSFSTKGDNRGLGTYSMKLFTEEYLGGRIDFTSTETDGTIFRVHLPSGT